jgi:hypothetical protein
MNVKFKVRGVEAVQSFLKSVPRGALKVALEAFTEYIVGNDAHGLKHTEPYKFASRKSAYGYTGAKFENGKPVPAGYFSKEQYRYVMAKIASGEITPGSPRANRGESSKAWRFTPIQGGYNYRISNDKIAQYWARDDYGQPRQIAKTNLRKVSKVLADNYLGGIRSAVAAVKRYLASK